MSYISWKQGEKDKKNYDLYPATIQIATPKAMRRM